MIRNSIQVLSASTGALSSMVVRRKYLRARSWRAELTCRFVQRLLQRSLHESNQWLRDCQKLLAMKGPALGKIHTTSFEIEGVPCSEIVPRNSDDELPTIVYFHGGGYVVGSVQGYLYTLAKLALSCQCKVIGVDYRCAPEHPLPAAQEDVLRVVSSIIESASPQAHIYLAGDSAGGGLVLNTLRELKEQGRANAIDGAVLISPWVRPYDPECLVTEFEESDILSVERVNEWVACFGEDRSEAKRVSDFSETSFFGFPPIYVQAGGREIFKDQIDDLVKRLRADRVNTAYDIFPDMFHVFQTFAPLVPEADRAFALIAKKLERLS